MPPKKAAKPVKEKLSADPTIDPTAIPPALPPSVEEAYRRKCVQLKQRTNEVEEENDATRIRLARIRRQIEKMRVERSFLLEQLTRRTSTNVEDSEGSPSPPPTPKDKPLRTKRGHRKPSTMAEIEASARKSGASPFVSQNLGTMSPSSEAFSHSQAPGAGPASRATNGVSKLAREPASAFELYSEDARPALLKKRADNEGEEEQNIEEELGQAWKDLPDAEREVFQTKHDKQMAEYEKEKEELEAAEAAKADETQPASPEKPSEDKATEDAPTKEDSKEAADKPAKEDTKEDEEMKDGEKEDPEPSVTAAAPETRDEDVEMADESEAAAEDKAAKKNDSKQDE